MLVWQQHLTSVAVSIPQTALWLLQEQSVGWDPISLWKQMGIIAKIVVIILFIMSGWSIGVMIDRAMAYNAARKQSRAFAPAVAGALRDGRIDEAIKVAERNKKSHLAKVVTAGLMEFKAHQDSPGAIPGETIEASKRALERTEAIVHAELKRGLGGLATIGSTAPFVGLFGTVMGILNAFKGISEQKATGLGAVAGGISEALVTTAFGLLVAIPAVMMFNYLTGRVEAFDVEMDNSSSELIDYFLKRRGMRLAYAGHRSTPEEFKDLLSEGSASTLFSQTSRIDHIPRSSPRGPGRGKPTELLSKQLPGVESLDRARRIDPPRSAYALLGCDEAVVAGREFPVIVGLDANPDPRIAGDHKLTRPTSSVGPYQLQVQIVADGFSLRDGESWRHQLLVTVEEPYPTRTIDLTPEMQSGRLWSRTIQAIYSVDGQTIGVAFRSVAVAMSPEILGEARQEEIQDSGVTLAVPTDKTAPDLTVEITYADHSGGLRWTMVTPHEGISISDEPHHVDLGEAGVEAAKKFARKLVDSVDANQENVFLYRQLVGQGRKIADKVPEEFWSVLRSVAGRKADRLPTVLFLSAEPYIPWELAVMDPPDAPPLNPDLPPFLGVQATVGRWILGRRRPRVPPPREQAITDIAVVWGVYDKPNWQRLSEAEDEAMQIQTKWNGTQVDAISEKVKKCFEGKPRADALHFALHGIYDPSSTENGLILVDGYPLDPDAVRGSDLTNSPFVFLNACQVGNGDTVLGDYSGMAEAFLCAGASGVVAPLWKIKDTLAKQLALQFYEATFTGTAPAEFLRQQRRTFRDSADTASATFLAYQFFGHPCMKLVRSR